MEIIEPARVESRPERSYVGIRIVTPFRGMLRVRDELLQEVRAWVDGAGVEAIGHGFMRLHVVDMDGPMDLEVGFFMRVPDEGDGRVEPGSMPAGRYATLTYQDHSLRANRALNDWTRDNGLAFDRREVPEGDAYACRYEAYLTDPSDEPRKTKWHVELATRIADN